MRRTDYKDETEILTSGTCNFFNHLGKGELHMHRQIEIMFSVKGDLTVTLGETTHKITTGDFVIIKPFELHTFESKKRYSNKFVSPILPDIISNKIANKLRKSVVFHTYNDEWGRIISLYKVFEKMSQDSKLLYFKMLEEIVNEAVSLNQPSDESRLADMIIEYIAENAAQPLTLDSVAAACCTNRCTVSKAVNLTCNQNFNSYLNRARISLFLQNYVEKAPTNLETAAAQAGFCSPRTFYRAFYEEFKMTPSEYVKKLK